MNQAILITGCQRSGTTLVHLILDSHPDITGIDELDFPKSPLNVYLEAPEYHPCVSFKLPVATYEADFVKTIPGIKVLWCIRDPRDVVLSMMNLSLKISADAYLPWAVHPGGAGLEIENSASTLKDSMSGKLLYHYNNFKTISRKNPTLWQLEEQVYVASLCWWMKQELLATFEENQIPYHIVRYENLLRNPQAEIQQALDFIGLPWHDNVLNHHQLHSGTSVGGTVNSRPIDRTNTEKWRTAFDTQTLSIIATLCAGTAAKYGYRLVDN